MPKKASYRRRRRKAFNLRRVRINAASVTGALAPLAVVSNPITSAVSDPLRFMSVKSSFQAVNGIAADEGAAFGLAHSDYTAAEVEECLEATGALDKGDKVAQEQANRLVREIGTLDLDPSTKWNDGRQIKIRLNWLMSTGDTLNLWIRNSSGTIYSTGGGIAIAGELWVKDGA